MPSPGAHMSLSGVVLLVPSNQKYVKKALLSGLIEFVTPAQAYRVCADGTLEKIYHDSTIFETDAISAPSFRHCRRAGSKLVSAIRSLAR